MLGRLPLLASSTPPCVWGLVPPPLRLGPESRSVIGLSFDYGQRQRSSGLPLSGKALGLAEHHWSIEQLGGLGWLLLTDLDQPVDCVQDGVIRAPTCRPQTVFIALGLSLAEPGAAWLGVNAIDYSGYPDCSGLPPGFQRLADLASRSGAGLAQLWHRWWSGAKPRSWRRP